MPQPMNRVTPQPMASFNSADLSKVSHLIIYPMQVIATWSEIDSILTEMLARFTTSDFEVIVSMLHSVRSQEAQLDMIKAAAKHVLPAADYDLFSRVEKSTKVSRTRRHQYAHHLWGVPNDPPDSLALLDPKNNLRGLAEIESKFRAWASNIGNSMESHIFSSAFSDSEQIPTDHIDWSRVKLYREDDLKRDVGDARNALRWFSLLSVVLVDPFPEVKDAARQRLLSELPILDETNTQHLKTPQSPPA